MTTPSAPAPHATSFPSTRWTLVVSARESPERRRALLGELLGAYWRPLYAFARRKGCDAPAAEDAVQGFLVHLLQGEFLTRVDPARGRMRAYLRTGMAHYLANLHASGAAQKRGGDTVTVSFDADLAERSLAAAPADADSAFDAEWKQVLLGRAMLALEAECKSGKRQAPFTLLVQFFGAMDAPSYQDAALAHNMSVPQLKSMLHRARIRLRELVLEEAKDTVSGDELAHGEVSALFGAEQA